MALVLEELRRELENLDSAIACLERIQGVRPKRGRPPRFLAELKLKKEADGEASRKTHVTVAARKR